MSLEVTLGLAAGPVREQGYEGNRGIRRGAISPRGAIALELNSIGRRFGDRFALSNVSLKLGYGQTLVIFGPNGAGKTSLLRIVATLLRPTTGNANILGLNPLDMGHRIRAQIGFLSHEPLLYRELTGRENLDFYARLYDLGDRARRIDELLATVCMDERANEPIRDLSRGMVQRLAICRAVLHRPKLLLLDEPQAHLDPEAAHQVEPLIGTGANLTRIVVTHDLEHGLAEADVVLGLRNGKPLTYTPAHEVDADQLRSTLYGGPVG